ncbi:MAG: helix-turn-helix domain-containing protein [Patulibacter sp.]
MASAQLRRHDEIIRTAALALERDAGSLAAEAATRIQQGMPELPTAFSVTSQSTAAVRELIAVFARSLLRADPTEDLIVPEQALEHGRMFVRRGVDLSALVRTYRVGHAVMWDVWVRVLDVHVADAETRLAVRDATGPAFFRFIDTVAGRVVEEYHAERERWSQSAASRRLETVRDLLDGQPTEIDAASRILGRELRGQHLGFVVWQAPEHDSTGAPARLQRTAQEFAADRGDARPLLVPVGYRVLWGWCGGGRGGASVVDRERPTHDGVRVALGEPGSGIEGFRTTHRQALAARRVAQQAAQATTVTAWTDVAVLGLLSADQELAREFARRELGELHGDDPATVRLRQTLAVFLREGEHVGRTAAQQGIHVNTVTNRLRQCEAAIGRPLAVRRGPLHAALALRDGLVGTG